MNKKDKKNLNRIRVALREVRDKHGKDEIHKQSYLEECINGKGIHVNNMCSVMNRLHKNGLVEIYGSENNYRLTDKL